MKRDGSNTPHHQETESTEASTFSGELKKAIEKTTPHDCYTVTYNSCMKLQPFFYTEQREYSRNL